MPKLKTHKGTKKVLKVRKGGSITIGHPGSRHNTGKKKTIAAAKKEFLTSFKPFFLSGSITNWENLTTANTINNIGTISWTKLKIRLRLSNITTIPGLLQQLPKSLLQLNIWKYSILSPLKHFHYKKKQMISQSLVY